MGMPRRWSYSSLSGWATQCQRKFVAVRINGVKDEGSKEAARGLVCHKILERFVMMPVEQRNEHTLADLTEEELELAKVEHARFYNNGFVRAVRNRIDTAFRVEDYSAIPGTWVERELTATTPDGHEIMGFADRIDRVGDMYYISDYKSGKASDWVLPGVAKQTALYAWMLNQMDGVPAENIVGRAVYLQCGTVKTISFTQDDLDDIAAWADSTIEDALDTIDNGSHWQNIAADPSPLCGWCALQDQCPDAQKPRR